MSKTRKVIFLIVGIVYLTGSGLIPPLFDMWNREGYIGPFPIFFVAIWLMSLVLVLAPLYLYWHERDDKTFEDQD